MQTVLIVDDYAPAVEWAMAALKALDCDLINTAGGRTALMTIRLRMPDLTLLDLRMADMDGFSVVRELRSDTATARLCIVAFTASAMGGNRASALNAGFTEFITKPIGLAAFRGQVRNLLTVGLSDRINNSTSKTQKAETLLREVGTERQARGILSPRTRGAAI